MLRVDPAKLNGRKGNMISSYIYIHLPLYTFSETNKNKNKHKIHLIIYAVLTPTCTVFIVYVYLACAFRYGSEDLDVMGLSFRRDIWVKRTQIYPFPGLSIAKTPMQESLLKKAEDQGYPFSFEVEEGILSNSKLLFLSCVD